jgi:hypothetical protein
MIDHESHLKNILEVQKKLSNEIAELNNILSLKKEQFFKHQGIVEYLTANGITPEENEKVTLPEK